MTTKKFKTVSGYLRSADMQLQYKLPKDDDDDARIAAIKTGQRNIINNLLPQLGLPKLDGDETPGDGVERLLALGGTDNRQVKALKDCQRWLKNYRFIVRVSSMVSMVESSREPVSYRVHGFRCDDTSVHVSIIVDIEWSDRASGKQFEIAKTIGGDDYCFHASENLFHPVPETVKNRLLSNEELYALAPQLNPQPTRRAARR
jgi:hypothetical protein